ncbi:MAG: DUF86 domain-containing protein [Bacteroidetes bacterium]|nr:DUF86 domain-containing protein [Bacteroidota bacterium]
MEYQCLTKLYTDETKKKDSSIEWEKIIALRNFLVHEYFGVDDSIIWDIINKDLPSF